MTSKTRRTEIQIETHEVKIVRFRTKQALARCERCGEIVTALTPEQAAEVQGEVFRLPEGEKVSSRQLRTWPWAHLWQFIR